MHVQQSINQQALACISILEREEEASREELSALVLADFTVIQERLFEAAIAMRKKYYNKEVYYRGLIEFSNYCKNNCYYCGIQKDNKNINRYRLTEEEILKCCETGYELGFRTFVLQSGEDPYYTKERMTKIIRAIRKNFVDCAITLSLGEQTKDCYQSYYDAGAHRYLLRHETADAKHYKLLHPEKMQLSSRKECLYTLKKIGFQVGAGFMVGSPYQEAGHLIEDLLFLKDLEPHMVGIGPFIPHKDTQFRDFTKGSVEETLRMIGITRLLLPKTLLPATTALGTIDNLGREKALKAGANVVMPNLSPVSVRKDYALYDDKICTGDEAAECRVCLERRIVSTGFIPVIDRGDHKDFV